MTAAPAAVAAAAAAAAAGADTEGGVGWDCSAGPVPAPPPLAAVVGGAEGKGAGAPEGGDAPLGVPLVSEPAPLPPPSLASCLLPLASRFCSPVPTWRTLALRRCGRRLKGWSVIALSAQRVRRGCKEDRWENISTWGWIVTSSLMVAFGGCVMISTQALACPQHILIAAIASRRCEHLRS